jgi:hypothetical protein
VVYIVCCVWCDVGAGPTPRALAATRWPLCIIYMLYVWFNVSYVAVAAAAAAATAAAVVATEAAATKAEAWLMPRRCFAGPGFDASPMRSPQ